MKFESTEQLISHWLGAFLVAIGRGDLRNEIYKLYDMAVREGYQHGLRDRVNGKRRARRAAK